MNIKLSIFIVLVIGGFVLTNCNSANTESTQQQQEITDEVELGWNSVMAVHDEIMPITTKLPPLWEQLDTLKNTVADTEVETVKQQISDLQAAHKAMYDWMATATNVGKSLKAMKKEAALAQLIDEKAQINQVKEATDTAFENAKILIERLTAE